MLRSEKSLHGYSIEATDGKIGTIHEFFFEDKSWYVRYLVVDTGNLLPGRKVLLFPVTLAKADWNRQAIPVGLSKARIENSPSTDFDKPVSAQHELELHKYYNWAPYWPVAGEPYGTAVPPVHLPESEREIKPGAKGDPHLRSCREVKGYHIQAIDGEIGHVEDFIIDDQEWKIRYFVIDTRNWLPGQKVLISPQWIDDINWAEGTVSINLSCGDVKASPKYDPETPINREYELQLYDYYGRPKHF